ncbi:MAG TPA: beta-phosphoglucomutase [Candidatus Pelethocola excrementipullorum]|nr:beta-phosphoglucomutase [Candidatus Pelethocola excrementipullorum]
MEIKAFIFDLDGVLTDTAEYHYQAWKRLAGRLGMKFDRKENERLKGVSRMQSLEIILELNKRQDEFSEEEKARLADEKNEEYVRLIQKVSPDDVLGGVMPFLREARENGMKLAVASASKNARTVLGGLNIAWIFDYIADAARIKNTKPDPEVFLNCAKHLGVPPGSCIGFEDAQAGIEAIHAAGMFAVGIHVDVTGDAPDLILSSTEELDYRTVMDAAVRKK